MDTVWKPALWYACTSSGSPLHTHSFWRRRSFGVTTGAREKKYTQPLGDHMMGLNPRLESSVSKNGFILSST